MLSKAYQLGRVTFAIESEDLALLDKAANLFETSLEEKPLQHSNNSLHVIDDAATIGQILTRVKLLHRGLVWLDASLLVSPSNQLVIVAGPSRAGKTTLSFALCTKRDYKVFCEGTVFFDTRLKEFIPFAAPFSLRDGTVELLHELEVATKSTKSQGIVYTDSIDGFQKRWMSSKKHVTKTLIANAPTQVTERVGSIDVAFMIPTPLGTVEANDVEGCFEVSAHEFIKKSLPVSNLMFAPDGVDCMSEILARARCFILTEENLNLRLERICGLSS